MGGYGSGRPGQHTKVEHCRSLDINELRRDGALAPGYWATWHWTDGSSIVLRTTTDSLHLTHRMGSRSKGQKDVSCTVPLTRVACTKGGSRPYFLCPGRQNEPPCGRRVAKLYLKDRRFLCRHCQQLVYASQSEPRHDRLLRRRNKLSDSLSRGNRFDLFPPRPKGMWRRTYEARLKEIWRLEEEAETAFMTRAAGRLQTCA